MSQEISYMPVEEFRKLGYLQELNRQFLHPLGLALSVDVKEDGTEMLAGIWDCRHDPEGIRYSELDEDNIQKAGFVMTQQRRKARVRLGCLGYIVQPILRT